MAHTHELTKQTAGQVGVVSVAKVRVVRVGLGKFKVRSGAKAGGTGPPVLRRPIGHAWEGCMHIYSKAGGTV